MKMSRTLFAGITASILFAGSSYKTHLHLNIIIKSNMGSRCFICAAMSPSELGTFRQKCSKCHPKRPPFHLTPYPHTQLVNPSTTHSPHIKLGGCAAEQPCRGKNDRLTSGCRHGWRQR